MWPERSYHTSNLSFTGSVLSNTTFWMEVLHRNVTGKMGSFGYIAPKVVYSAVYAVRYGAP